MSEEVKVGQIYKQKSGAYPSIRREVTKIEGDQITYRVYNLDYIAISIPDVEILPIEITKVLPLDRFLMNSVLTHDFKN